METQFTSKPILDSSRQFDLGNFLNASAHRNANDLPELLNWLGENLIKYANCVALFWVDPLDSNTPKVDVVATRLEYCPDTLQHWACTTAVRALTRNMTAIDSSAVNPAQPLSMIATPLQTDARYVLAALFAGSEAKQFPPFLQIAADRVDQWNASMQLNSERQTSLDVAALQEISLAVADSKSTRQACRKLVNNLKVHLAEMAVHAELIIYIGKNAQDKFPVLVGMSGSDSLPVNTQLTEAIESAMAECISRNAATSWPPEGENFSLLCHKRLANLADNQHVYSFQLFDNTGRPQAVLTVQSDSPLAQRANNFLSTAQTHLGVALSLADRNEKNKLQRFFDKVLKNLREKRAKTICKVLAGIFLLGMIPLPYQIKATTEVQPAERMFLHAPFAVPLKESLVVPGDLVLEGTALARLDDKELSIEVAEVQADLHRADKKWDGFVATHEPGEARLARHESEVLEARLNILKQRANQLTVRSPIEGMVIAGDWKNAAGMPLETGQSLYEIAPLEKLSIDIYIPEDDVRFAEIDQSVRIKFDAYPFEAFYGKLASIHPAAELQNSESVFVATVLMNNPDGKLRPGMKGKARCSSVWQPIWLNLLQKPAARCLRSVGW